VDAEVLDKAGVVPEVEIHPEEGESETSGEGAGDLSLFEEFFSKLDTDDTDQQKPENGEDGPNLVP
jgi:hypothetical protein